MQECNDAIGSKMKPLNGKMDPAEGERNRSCVLAIDAGGTFFKSMLVSMDGIGLKESYHVLEAGNDKPAADILSVYRSIVNHGIEYAGKNGLLLQGIGVSTPGPFDYKEGKSLMTHKFKSIYGYNLKNELIKYSGCENIVFINDVLAFLSGEICIGSGEGFSRIAAVIIGTGIGIGCMIDGRLLRDGDGRSAVRIYNDKFKDGIVEDYVSRRGILKLYSNLIDNDELNIKNKKFINGIDVKELEEMARENNGTALKVFRETGHNLGAAIKNVIDEYKIERLILGGQISRATDLMLDGIIEGMGGTGSVNKITAGKDIGSSALIGAASLVFAVDE